MDEIGNTPSSLPIDEQCLDVLRHTFATIFLQKGASLAALKKILGHDRLSTTEIYLNLTDHHIVEEYERKW